MRNIRLLRHRKARMLPPHRTRERHDWPRQLARKVAGAEEPAGPILLAAAQDALAEQLRVEPPAPALPPGETEGYRATEVPPFDAGLWPWRPLPRR